MLLLIILGFYRLFHFKLYELFHPKLFLVILSNFHIWLLVAIILIAINSYYIGDY
jgi:hypothetical protein